MIDLLKKWWKQILAVVAAIVGIVLIDKNKELKAKLEHVDYSKKDAVLTAEQEMKKQEEADVLKKAEEEKTKPVSKEEMVDFLKKL